MSDGWVFAPAHQSWRIILALTTKLSKLGPRTIGCCCLFACRARVYGTSHAITDQDARGEDRAVKD